MFIKYEVKKIYHILEKIMKQLKVMNLFRGEAEENMRHMLSSH